MTTQLFSNAATEEELEELTTLYALDEKKVRKWDRVKVQVMLDSYRRADAITRRRAERVAAGQDGEPARGQPSRLEREVAAAQLEASLAGNIDDLASGLLVVSHALTDDECRAVALHLISVLRGNDAEHRPVASEGGGLRLAGEGRGWQPDFDEIPA